MGEAAERSIIRLLVLPVVMYCICLIFNNLKYEENFNGFNKNV